ncbi:hypothetical protein ACFO5R_03845 [Halosolutus amylolyticus]|uniref:Uncharacterized protein n=1 Tax=Halosolutus amylolyticus TaxID=2932267 RepID=A0ABD5PKR8_9EURY|nr:hypothetical protein [Halosolutus amylolyticus]
MAELFTTEKEGVTVTKHVDSDGDEVRVGLRLDSSRERPSRVRLQDTVPADVTVQVPTADPPRYSASDRTVEFERTLGSDESLTTGYRYARDGAAADVERHETPSLVVETTSGGSGDGAEPTPDEDDEFEMPEDEMSVTDIVHDATVDPEATSDPRRATADGNGAVAATAGDRSPDEADLGELVDAVLHTLDADASPAQRDRLARELTALDGSRSSLELRVSYLQSRFQDLATYVDAMEEFIDDHGTGEDVLTEVMDELRAVREQLSSVRDEQATLESRLDALEDRTGQIESTVERRQDDLEAEVQALDDRLESRSDDFEDEVRRLEDGLERVEATQGTVQERVRQFTAFRDAMEDAFQGAQLSSEE